LNSRPLKEGTRGKKDVAGKNRRWTVRHQGTVPAFMRGLQKEPFCLSCRKKETCPGKKKGKKKPRPRTPSQKTARNGRGKGGKINLGRPG